MKQMVEVRPRGSAVATIGVMSVDPQEVGSYGIVETAAPEGDIARIVRIVEKPKPGSTTSTKAVVGRYVLTPRILPPTCRTIARRRRREIQLTDAIARLLVEERVVAYEFKGDATIA